MLQTISDKEISFLEESNLIEGIGPEGLDDSVKAWRYIKRQKSITAVELLKMHKLLMRRLDPRIAGEFRNINVMVGNRICPLPSIAKKQTEELLISKFNRARFKNLEKGKLKYYAEICKNDHISYEKNHPFEDGNGRTGRILLNWQRLQYGLPLLILKAEKRQDYYLWFK